MSETTSVRFQVLGVERVRGPANLIGLAIIDLEIDGLAIVVQGVRVTRDAKGGLSCQATIFRHPDGQWLPCLLLPPELTAAIGAQVLEHLP